MVVGGGGGGGGGRVMGVDLRLFLLQHFFRLNVGDSGCGCSLQHSQPPRSWIQPLGRGEGGGGGGGGDTSVVLNPLFCQESPY